MRALLLFACLWCLPAAEAPRAGIGIRLEFVQHPSPAALVTHVRPDSLAAHAGVFVGCRLVAIDGYDAGTADYVATILDNARVLEHRAACTFVFATPAGATITVVGEPLPWQLPRRHQRGRRGPGDPAIEDVLRALETTLRQSRT